LVEVADNALTNGAGFLFLRCRYDRIDFDAGSRGIVVYLIVTYIPMPDVFKTIILVVVAIFLIVYLMGVFGISDIAIPRLRQ
jgi:hypothetical protein